MRARAETQRLEPELRATGRVRQYRDLWRDPVLKEKLITVFQGKCAYCESSVVASSFVNVDNFRPKSRVLEDPSFPGYWWLAYEWDNLYPCCQLCGTRGSRFPISGERASPFDTGTALLKENPLLIDPCLDNPEDHLVFHDNGTVVGKSDRGKTTIQIFNLNRESLVEERRWAVAETTLRVQLAVLEKRDFQELKRLLNDPRFPYLAARRAALNRKILELRGTL
jgi:uncharacterized protein (TIGR02646 family)